ncbi:RCC1 domain-containing protein [Candidatus Poriferisodalis sp.]|uniref:RCC1 domain-containing protein n=1 Tax=Candidatus Poriferisodalis sp. TaxID=3101277 RepID=UPI003B5AEF07
MRLARTGLGIVLLALATTALPAAGGAHRLPDVAGQHGAHAIGGAAKVHTSKMASGLSWRRAADSIAVGETHSCGLRADGQIECWGAPAMIRKPPKATFTAVTSGFAHACGLHSGGRIRCWGIDAVLETPSIGTFTAVSAGSWHVCGLQINGEIACWGDNRYGQASPPTGTFTAVSAGWAHSCALRTDGQIECWGYDRWEAGPFLDDIEPMAAEPGQDPSRSTTAPCVAPLCFLGRASPPAGTFTAVSAGSLHGCGLRTDGQVECWGFNEQGQASPPPGAFTAVSAALWHTCGLRTGGEIECWGDDHFGQASPPAGTFATAFHFMCVLQADERGAC